MKLYLLTLKDAILRYQGRKRLTIENRLKRNNYNAFRELSQWLGYKDETTLYKMINQSTSRVKLGVRDLAKICIRVMDSSAIEDLLREVNEEIENKKEKIKSEYQEQLSLLD